VINSFNLVKSRDIWRGAFLPVLDFFALLTSSVLVYQIRYHWFDNNFVTGWTKDLSLSSYLNYAFLISLGIVIIYAFQGSYKFVKENLISLVFQLSLGILFVLGIVIFFLFFNEYNQNTLPEGVPVSRFILAVGGFVALYSVLIGRLLFNIFENILYRLDIGRIEVLIVGKDQAKIAKWLKTRLEVSIVHTFNDLDKSSFQKIKKLLANKKIKEVYLYSKQNPLEIELSHLTSFRSIDLIFYPNIEQYLAYSFKPVYIGQKTFLKITHSRLDGWWLVVKRLFDICCSSIGLILVLPVFVVIATAIKADSKGPVFYLSERVGPDGRVFKLWKFRRLKQEYCTYESNPLSKQALEYEKTLIDSQKNIKKGGILYKISNDPRQTKVGKFLEKTSLDELPQLINCLFGSMSLVGPRPHQPREVSNYQAQHFKVLNIKPGVTGLSQVNGRSDITFEQEVSMDSYYLENWSLFLDLWIILQTPIVIFFKRHKG